MEKLKQILEETVGDQFLQMTISNPRQKGEISKIKIRPVLLKGTMYFQESVFKGNQVLHNNIPWDQREGFLEKVVDYMGQFKQIEWETGAERVTALVNKKQQASIKRKKQEKEPVGMEQFAHDRKKKYILEEGVAADFLVELGVMTKEGKVVKAKYDKFRQINRFLEFIDDVTEHFPKNREITVIDFGCGKSYLTFAIYYYLKVLKNYDIRIIGLDLKQDVINYCNRLAKKLHYDKLQFLHGDIAEYEGVNQADMVVTLHACDTATDFALAKAVKWNAKVILSVPCCQHELNKQMHNDVLSPLFRYGIIKERTAALFTDALRAQLLEQHGYQVQLLEFIDLEHTPKNILIRGVQKKDGKGADRREYEQCRDFLGAQLTLEKLLQTEV